MASLGGNEVCQAGEEEELGACLAHLSLEMTADRGARRCL